MAEFNQNIDEFYLNLQSSKGEQPEEKKELQFVNYVTKDEELSEFNPRKQKNQALEIEDQYFKETDAFVQNFLNEEQSKQINIIPKKSNVDLKRFLTPKLEKLNKKTEKAIIKLLKDKLKKEKEEEVKEQNKEKEQKKLIEQQILEQKIQKEKEIESTYNPVFSADGYKYDAEIVDDIEEQDYSNMPANTLIKDLDAEFNIFANFDEDLEESS
ncbi:hypothetical protein PPERSA_09841 [Pseudocohnilembus persalinus]|uniref:Uncharacterized protein n=1 Tax=Pseudocohnilembus persalinus TaxID=266149 RepID=A0A0V0QV12_PSEPJ|nr:hypothetical protein PPERSA_09841 [Pseudocohnilembus persalinus]|eukprot:KRX05701.1 hypothetical protein PPERSA_09841 [Pseudocohnilembus persalinus]